MLSVALDLNIYAPRGVLVGPDGIPLGNFVGGRNTTCRSWLKGVLHANPGASVIGSPLDDWPPDIVELVNEAGSQLHWLSPILLRRLYSVCRPWNLNRKLHKARFLAHLHRVQATPWDAEGTTRDFERFIAQEMINL